MTAIPIKLPTVMEDYQHGNGRTEHAHPLYVDTGPHLQRHEGRMDLPRGYGPMDVYTGKEVETVPSSHETQNLVPDI